MKKSNFKLKKIGKIENDFSDVYDREKEKVISLIDTDSNYYQLEPIFKRLSKETFKFIYSQFSKDEIKQLKNITESKRDLFELLFILYHDDNVIDKKINLILRGLEDKFNTTKKLGWNFEGESEIKTQTIFKKKQYMYKPYQKHIVIKGLELIKSNSSFFIRKEIKELFKKILLNVTETTKEENNIFYEDEIKRMINETFKNKNPFEISNPVNVGSDQWDKWIIENKKNKSINDINGKLFQKYTPIKNASSGVVALCRYRNIINDFDEFKNFDKPKDGKIHTFKVKRNNRYKYDYIGIPFDLNEKQGIKILNMFDIDYKRQWFSKIDKIVSQVYDVYNFEKDKKRNKVVENFLFEK